MEKRAKLILMRGIPGSGKSTVADLLKMIFIANDFDIEIFSTDEFWYLRSEDGKTYEYDPALVGKAHKWNQVRTYNHLKNGGVAVVDNTNLDSFAVAPYFDMAYELGINIAIEDVDTALDICIDRQKSRPSDRQVPEDVIRAMHEKFVQPLDVNKELEKAKLRSQLRTPQS